MKQRIKNIYHLYNAIIANLFFGFPSQNLTIIGVTGTDGKTTTVSLIYHILHEAGYEVSMISTVGAIIGGKTYDVGFHVTNPSSFPLQRFLKKASKHGKYLVLEVTSHGLDQNRTFGIHFDVGVLTNVTHEHLDYHKTYHNYLKTKLKLLQQAKIAIVNYDDESYLTIKEMKSFANKNICTFGLSNAADINPNNFPYKAKLLGEFNTYNILAAAAVCRQLSVPEDKIKQAISSFTPPIGRQEVVYDKSFSIIIDFAHTPNAFEKILSAIKKTRQGRIIHVFGAAGERDVSKRPLMGSASAKYADIIILTAEDPRSEGLMTINDQIVQGIPESLFPRIKNQEISRNNKKYVIQIPDRSQAILFAISQAKKGDTVLLTGKSHEKSMNYGKGEEPWNEHTAVQHALTQLKII